MRRSGIGRMPEFTLDADNIGLPAGAFARTSRRRLRRGDQTVLCLTQGAFRPYVYPLFTPAGFCATSEAPADHPHHSSLWIACDHFGLEMPAADATIETYSYNFYVNETFQGRAPGRVIETGAMGETLADGSFLIVQDIEWRGPVEWSAPGGRLAARERRSIRVEAGERHYLVDVTSRLLADELAVELGPTRHAWFNVRVADSMIVENGGRIADDRGRAGAAAVCGEGAGWVDFSGPVGGGQVAGITVVPHPVAGRTPFWFVADWGVVTVGPFRRQPLRLDPGGVFETRTSVIVHDGNPEEACVPRLARELLVGG
jgi:hypothetical protein